MRKARAKKRIQTPDPRYKDILISRFINCMMLDGKKGDGKNITVTFDEHISKGTQIWIETL